MSGRIRLLAPLAIAAVMAALPSLAAGQAEPAPAPAALPTITVVRVEPRVLHDVVRASGLIGAEETVFVQPQIEGQAIERLLADVGDTVAAGAVLAELSQSALGLQKSQLEAARAAARAGIAQAEAQLVEVQAAADEANRVNERTKALRAQGTASQAQADQVLAAATSANARVAVARQTLESAHAQLALNDAQIANTDLQLARSRVTAPVAGRITARNAMVGAIASAAGQPMFTLIRDGQLELHADVAEGDLGRIAAGQRAALYVIGGGGAIAGTVRLVEPAIDTATRLGTVRIAIDPAATGLRPGTFAETEIQIARREAPAVPVSAVSDGAEGASVMLVTDGVVARRPVVTGIRDDGWIEIRGGLAEGDTVVLKAGAFVRDGDRVSPLPAPAAALN